MLFSQLITLTEHATCTVKSVAQKRAHYNAWMQHKMQTFALVSPLLNFALFSRRSPFCSFFVKIAAEHPAVLLFFRPKHVAVVESPKAQAAGEPLSPSASLQKVIGLQLRPFDEATSIPQCVRRGD